MANRILDAAARYAGRIETQRKAGVSLDGKPIGPALERLDENMALTHSEHYAFQTAQAQAHAGGRITTDEARTVYVALGESMSSSNGGWGKHVELPLKVAITQLISELI